MEFLWWGHCIDVNFALENTSEDHAVQSLFLTLSAEFNYRLIALSSTNQNRVIVHSIWLTMLLISRKIHFETNNTLSFHTVFWEHDSAISKPISGDKMVYRELVSALLCLWFTDILIVLWFFFYRKRSWMMQYHFNH